MFSFDFLPSENFALVKRENARNYRFCKEGQTLVLCLLCLDG